MENYSVLMSVYHKEKGEFLETAIVSMLNQTIKTNDFVLVCDGPLNEELDAVISKFEKDPIFNVVRIEKNQGLGNALKTGLPLCKNEIVLRMDSDDISRSDRAEKEIAKIEEGYDIVGAYISEFQNNNPEDIFGYRKPPVEHNDILVYAKKRSPFNHPSVAFKKSKIIEAGSYQTLLYAEDFYLWVRCILKGCKCYNISEPLVNMRSGVEMRARRGGKQYRKSMRWLFKYMWKQKMISWFTYQMNAFKFNTYSILPMKLKVKLTEKFLREKK